jgi:ATP-dependent helicase HepA
VSFSPGQRWQSTTEPELGLGLILAADRREVVVSFPSRDVTRRYATEAAPLARARLTEGQLARGRDGTAFQIEAITEAGPLLVYRGEGRELSEQDLDDRLDVGTPENRLRTGQLDPYERFDLRADALALRERTLASPARGFFGGRIRLFDHQLSIAREVCDRHRVRILLADEVGLGKTIEALLILHRLLLTGRVERALVLVPPALVHQWLAEAFLKFNLVLRILGRDEDGKAQIDPGIEDLPDELAAGQLFIAPLGDEAASKALAASEWDFVAVDEAHHVEPGTQEFALIEALAGRTDHVVLLSATPDRDGEAAHFRRLALLEPERFADFEAWRAEASHYAELAETADRLRKGETLTEADAALLEQRLPGVADLLGDARKPRRSAARNRAQRRLLQQLLDLHGLGRVMFRNVRAAVPGFPRRVPSKALLHARDKNEAAVRERLQREFLADIGQDDSFRFASAEHDPRTAWLETFLASRPEDEKVLVLCETRAKVEAFAKALETPKREVARFHEAMSSLERDRQAAWFLAPDGPMVLISSALGAEGRNFQVARHLVLLDLPLDADRLEQRIGRVDRIGQGAEIQIWAPTLPGTPQDRLRRWHDEALSVFARPWHGAGAIEREFRDTLLDALFSADERSIDALVAAGRARDDEVREQLEHGRDRLLEIASFDAEAADEIASAIAETEDGPWLERFMLAAFESVGLDVEELGERSYALVAGADYHRPLPGFTGERMVVTFDRAAGLAHPDRVFLTPDHPMPRDVLDDLLGSDVGNASFARGHGDHPGLALEALFVAEPTLARALRADRFFPPTPVRVFVDPSGEPLDDATVALDDDAEPALLEQGAIRDLLDGLVERARTQAEEQLADLTTSAVERAHEELHPALRRLEQLAELTGQTDSLSAAIEAARTELETIEHGLANARLRLDALRLVAVMG